jgi:hypothetical protein
MRKLILIAVLIAPTVNAAMYKCQVDGKTKTVGMPCEQYIKFFSSSNKNLVIQRTEPKSAQADEAKTSNAITEDSATKKSWLEKRSEERAAKKEQQIKDHDSRTQAANDEARFKKLIWNKTAAVGMSESQVRKALGKSSYTKSGEDENGSFKKLTFKRYKNRLYIGKQIVKLRNGKVISIEN